MNECGANESRNAWLMNLLHLARRFECVQCVDSENAPHEAASIRFHFHNNVIACAYIGTRRWRHTKFTKQNSPLCTCTNSLDRFHCVNRLPLDEKMMIRIGGVDRNMSTYFSAQSTNVSANADKWWAMFDPSNERWFMFIRHHNSSTDKRICAQEMGV